MKGWPGKAVLQSNSLPRRWYEQRVSRRVRHRLGAARPDTGNLNHFGAISSYRTLRPGETFKKDVRLDKWFKFEEADTYLVTGMYRVLWTDFAVGECVVRVEEGKK